MKRLFSKLATVRAKMFGVRLCCSSTDLRARDYSFIASGKEDMNIDRDLDRIALQEKRLRFKEFNSDVAWALGTALKTAAEQLRAIVVIDIQLQGFPLFSYAMAGATPDNWEWIRRKRNVVMRYHRSSYAIGLKHERAQTTLQSTVGLDLKDYSTHGGSFPIILEGTGCVGAITVSGLPQREDHGLVVSALQNYLRLQDEDLALEPHRS